MVNEINLLFWPKGESSCRSQIQWWTGILIAALSMLPLAGVGRASDSAQKQKTTQDLTKLSLEELADLEVTTVARKPERRSQVPAAIHVITQEDIRRSGATSIVEALRLAPGVQVARVDSNKWALGVRGFASRLSRSTLALMDGRSVYTPLFAGVYWEAQDTLLEDIDRIEVIRGPGGTLWGANAVNGVINIITRSPEETQGALVTTGGGLNEQGFAQFRYGGKAGANAFYRVYGKAFSRDALFHHDGRNFDDWRMGQVGFRTDWSHRERDNFTLQGDLYGGETGQRTNITTLSPPALTMLEKNADLSGGNILARWRRQTSGTSNVEVQAYYDRTNRRELSFQENRDTFDLDFQHRFAARARHDVIWGLGYRLSSGDVSGEPTLAFHPARRTDNLFSGFLEDQVLLVEDRLSLMAGAKFEHNGYSGAEAQPSLRLLWTPDPKHTVWSSVGRAVRTPSRIEHDLELTALLEPRTPSFLRVARNRDFVSEKLLAYEVGYRVQPSPRLLLDLATFYHDYDDLLSVETGTPFFEAAPPPNHLVVPLVLKNGMHGKTYGVEVAGDWQALGRWRLKSAYSYLGVNLSRSAGSGDVTTERSMEGSSPRHTVTLQSFLNLPRNFEWDVIFRYVDDLPSQLVGDYGGLDVRLGWRPNRNLEFSIVGQNLLQQRHPEFGGGTGGLAEVKRGAYGKVTWRW